MIITAKLIVAVVLEEGDVVEVALVGRPDPDHLGGVGKQRVKTVDTEEDKGGVEEVFHEDNAHLFRSYEFIVGLFLTLANHFLQFFSLFAVVCHRCPVLGNGWHETVGITIVMVGGIVVLRRPYDDLLFAGNELIVAALGGCYTKEREEVIVGGEHPSFLQDAGRIRRTLPEPPASLALK